MKASLLLGFLALASLARADNAVIVHEWGTFTCLQDADGRAIGGINVDDEPVPPFVYGMGGVRAITRGPATWGLPPYQTYASKGWRPGDQDVTMRLETPVLYIYPSARLKTPPLDVHVDFHGGMLSQYYPFAQLSTTPDGIVRIPNGTLAGLTSSLDWKDVRLGSCGPPVETADPVWTTPREVQASVLNVPATVYDNTGAHQVRQSEHFLFYRGIGHLDSPLSIASTSTGAISIEPQDEGSFASTGWLAQIRADGTCAFADLGPFRIGEKAAMTPPGCRFDASSFSRGNLARLQSSMHTALVKEGLYPDEATAMLKTWELSYFKSPGLRFFYIVPRAWVDAELPLRVTGAPVDLTRVMIGRIELITAAQRAALARIAAGPCPDLAAARQAAVAKLAALPPPEAQAFERDEKPLTALAGLDLPPLVADYLSLGRFRDALVVHEQKDHPTPSLAQFIERGSIAGN